MYELKAAALDSDEMSAWFAGRIPRAVRIIPFGGPIPRKGAPIGVDVDSEWFDSKTDIKADWFSERPILWHHGLDPYGVMGTTLLGKARDLRLEEDGWWEDQWLRHGEERLARVQKLVAKGGTLFGSSQPLAMLVRKASTGRILQWPHAESTISTSPQNTASIIRPAKALLEDFSQADITVSGPIRELLAEVEALSDLDLTSEGGEGAAKAGRVLSARNESALREALDRLSAVLAQLQKDEPDVKRVRDVTT